MKKFKRIFVIVTDSLGIGEMPDADKFGDKGANTFVHISEKCGGLNIPTLNSLGVGDLGPIVGTTKVKHPHSYSMKMKEASNGKDTMTGHWEMMGIYTTKPFVTFTDTGFPQALINELEEKIKEWFGDNADKVLEYKETFKKDEMGYAGISALEPAIKATIENRAKEGSNKDSYYYRFMCDIPGDDNPGTFHSVDLWFFFETLAKSFRPFVGRHYDLSRYMCNYLANFVKTGNPNGCDADGSSMPEWKPYSEADRQEMHFLSEGPVMRTDADERTRFLIDLCLKEG